jgi:hypothetical protein
MAVIGRSIRRGAGLLGFRSGPLTRRSDRLQALARLLLLVAVLASVPVGVTVPVAMYQGFRQQEIAAPRSSWTTMATLLADAPVPTDPDPSGAGAPQPLLTQSLVTWATSAGGQRQGVVAVPGGATAGSTVRIWIDPRGTVSTAPPGGGDPVAEAVGIGVLIVVGCPALALTVYLLFRALVDRRRLREWASGWEVVEPVWSGKVR